MCVRRAGRRTWALAGSCVVLAVTKLRPDRLVAPTGTLTKVVHATAVPSYAVVGAVPGATVRKPSRKLIGSVPPVQHSHTLNLCLGRMLSVV